MSDDIFTLPPPPPDQRIQYGSEPNQFLDLRLPKANVSSAPCPLLLNIHGGFWRARYDLAHAGHLCAALTKQGIISANVEYRRVGNPGGGWPGTFSDICLAFDFLVKHAADHQLDTNRILIMGHSAGGQLALCLAAQRPAKAVISLAGVVSLRRTFELHLSNDAVVEFLGGTPDDVPQHYFDADPMQVSVNISQILFHGSTDEDVPPEFSRDYVAHKRKQREDVRLIEIPGADHDSLIDPRTSAFRQVEETVLNLLR